MEQEVEVKVEERHRGAAEEWSRIRRWWRQEREVCLPSMPLQERRQLRRVRLHRRRGVALAEGRAGPRREDVVRQHAAEHL